MDTRNWDKKNVKVGEWYEVRWINLDNIDPDKNDLRLRGYEKGAARFARGEGICYADNSVFLTATTRSGSEPYII